jgi:hypothetical protein
MKGFLARRASCRVRQHSGFRPADGRAFGSRLVAA